MKKLILLAAIPLAISCNNTDKKATDAAPKKDSTTTTPKAADTTAKAATNTADWNTFYKNFQTAVKNKDTAAIRTMCDAKSFDSEFLTNMINYMVESDVVRNMIINTPVEKTNQKPDTKDIEELKKYTDIKSVETYEKYGEDMGSISNYYFTIIDGQYKLVHNLQAG